MTDKEKIRREVQRLRRFLGEQRDANLDELIGFIDSLPENPECSQVSPARDTIPWIRVFDQLPEVGITGESDFVLAYRGHRIIPQIVQYSDGTYAKKGWHTQIVGEYIPFFIGTGANRRLTFTHWAKLEFPKED